MTRRLISAIAPAYNEEDCVDELVRRLAAVFDSNDKYDFEAVIVENGSTDSTFELLKRASMVDGRFKVLRLSRNFGMDGGITAGLEHISGDAAVIMTADLQDPPELITIFLQKWEEGYEKIYIPVSERTGTGPLRRLNTRLFYWLADRLTDHRIPRDASDFRLVDRKVYESVREMKERNRFVRGLFAWVGFRSISVEQRQARSLRGSLQGTHTNRVEPGSQRGPRALLRSVEADHHERNILLSDLLCRPCRDECLLDHCWSSLRRIWNDCGDRSAGLWFACLNDWDTRGVSRSRV